jgi:aconitase A
MPMPTEKSPTARQGADAGLYRRTAVVDLAAMREAVKRLGGDTAKVTRFPR